ncbi:MAG TPA: hypothetical protein VMU39_09810 [Solirubrobacteraceae bacterium]|nr:hypothetical protein [Solirubrobacteraceae bacterium]
MHADTRAAILRAMLAAAPIVELTPAQSAFAEKYRAVPAVRSAQNPRLVFMYRDEEHRTSRWLVDSEGDVLDVASFRHPIRFEFE